jgi:antitoxin Phd
MTWTLAEAKDQLSRVVRQAVDEGPQTITVRGRETAVVIAKEEYDRLRPATAPRDFKAFLLSIPSLEGVDLSRDSTPARDVEL